MSLPASGGTAFTTATCVKAWIEYPFANMGDSATKVYHHTMRVSRANYAPLAFDDVMTTADEKPTRSPFSDDAAAYWVGDTTPTAVQGDLVEFDRVFSNIPESRVESTGTYPFTFPEIKNPSSILEYTVAESTGLNGSFVVTGSPGDYTLTLTIDISYPTSYPEVDNMFSVGNSFYVRAQGGAGFQQSSDDVIWSSYDFFSNMVVESVNGNSVVFKKSGGVYKPYYRFYDDIIVAVDFSVIQPPQERDLLSENARSRIKVDYFKWDSVDEFVVLDAFRFKDDQGNFVTLLDGVTTPTLPLYYIYKALGAFVNADYSDIDRWRGNIFKRTTTQISML